MRSRREARTSPDATSAAVRARANELGFDLVGITRRFEPDHREYFLDWLAKNADKRLNPSLLLPGARGVVVVGISYNHDPQPGEYALARYAHGRDYHIWMKEKLAALAEAMRDELAPGSRNRAFVDTGPVLERDLAAKAGLGWIGKNTCLVHPELGSYIFLGVVLTTAELAGDAPVADRCGDCRLCVEACPTGALEPYRLDAGKCLAYWNIEHRGERAEEFRRAMGNRLAGCDDCQEACPYNRDAPPTRQKAWLESFAGQAPGSLEEMLLWDEAEYKRRTRDSALSRIRYEDFLRNALLVITNTGRADLRKAVRAWGERHPEGDLAELRWCLGMRGFSA